MTAETTEAVAAEYHPRIADTYALVYAFVLLFLVPGTALLARLPFGDARTNTYSLTYVSLVTVPFVLGLVAAILSDSPDGFKAGLIRSAILTPIVVISGVTVMFLSSIAIVPVSGFITPQNFDVLTPIAAGLLALLAAPLAIALFRKLRDRARLMDIVQAVVISMAIALVAVVVYLTLTAEGALTGFARKDTVIYVIGALTWYLPSFGLAAGVWRRLGLV